ATGGGGGGAFSVAIAVVTAENNVSGQSFQECETKGLLIAENLHIILRERDHATKRIFFFFYGIFDQYLWASNFSIRYHKTFSFLGDVFTNLYCVLSENTCMSEIVCFQTKNKFLLLLTNLLGTGFHIPINERFFL
ncbi:hypothetical protein ACJX0J_040968, partial [Zea mays]